MSKVSRFVEGLTAEENAEAVAALAQAMSVEDLRKALEEALTEDDRAEIGGEWCDREHGR